MGVGGAGRRGEGREKGGGREEASPMLDCTKGRGKENLALKFGRECYVLYHVKYRNLPCTIRTMSMELRFRAIRCSLSLSSSSPSPD